MITVYTADDWNKKKKIDPKKVAAEKKKAADAAKAKREAEDAKKPGYQKPSGTVAKASK